MKRILTVLGLVLALGAAAKEPIRILGIGNSFSEDSIEQNFYELALSDGTPVIVANMYIGGCSIDRHVKNLTQDLPEYRYTKFSADGNKSVTYNVRLSEVINEEPWDYISVQQVSGNSGIAESYSKLSELVTWVAMNAPQAKILFHQTWAYAKGSNHPDFPRYNCNQEQMYQSICNAVRQECPRAGLYTIIPTGTAMQLAREALHDPNLTRDGFHMSLGFGRYLAACCWYETITGRSTIGLSYRPDGSDKRTSAISRKEARVAQECAHKAVLQWRGALDYQPSAENLAAREQFSQHKLGVFIHWGIYSMMANGEWVQQTEGLPAEEYSRLAGGFYPSRFDALQWVRAIKRSGARYITITSRHHDGFSMFKTAQSNFNIVDATPFGRDVIKELADACHQEGIALHLYYSHLDWHRDDYYPLGSTGHSAGRPQGDAQSWNHYQQFMKAQLTELLTNYGPIGAIWFDGVWDKGLYPSLWDLHDQYELIHTLQPSCLVGNNHHKAVLQGEDIQIFERDVPGQNESGYNADSKVSSLPLETCQTMNWTWGYNMKDSAFKSTEDLVRLLVKTASKGANLLLNIGPRPDGTFQEASIERFNELGDWMDTYGESIYGTSAGPVEEQAWGVCTAKQDIVYAHVLDWQESIELPFKAARVCLLKDGKTLEFRNSAKGVSIKVPQMPETDIVIAIKKK